MHNLILGQRNAIAMDRIVSASERLAAYFEIDPALASGLKVQEKDPLIRAMKEREAVADLLEAIQAEVIPTTKWSEPAPLADPEEPAPQDGVDLVPEGVTVETGEGLPAPVLDDEHSEEVAAPVDKKSKRNK